MTYQKITLACDPQIVQHDLVSRQGGHSPAWRRGGAGDRASQVHGAPRGLVEDSVVADRASLAWLGILPTCLRSCVGRSASQHDGLGLPGLLIKYGPVVACSRAREAHRCVFLVYPTFYVGRLYIPVCGSFYEGGSLPSVSFGLPGSGSGGRH